VAVVEQALAQPAADPATGAAAWTTIGRMRLAAGDTPAPSRPPAAAQASNPRSEAPAILALELMDPKVPQAEAIVRTYLQGQPMPELRMGYARALLDAQRIGEAQQQLQIVTTESPNWPRPGWRRARCRRRTTSCRPPKPR
jgi:predicted Zn-dependent protease